MVSTAELSSITEFPLVHLFRQKLIERLNKCLSAVEIHKTQQELEKEYSLAEDVVGMKGFWIDLVSPKMWWAWKVFG